MKTPQPRAKRPIGDALTSCGDACASARIELLAHMPEPVVYEQEYTYWPWGRLLSAACEWIRTHAPADGLVVDYMCGTGYLLNMISKARPDLMLVGCDILPSYVAYAHSRYPHLDIQCCDARDFKPPRVPAVVVCTAGLHHLPRHDQEAFVEKVAQEMPVGSLFVLGEEIIGQFHGDADRKAAVLEMAFSLLSFAVAHGAPGPVLAAAVEMLCNDLLERGEYKCSDAMLLGLLKPYFVPLDVQRVWPDADSSYGDLLYCCRRL